MLKPQALEEIGRAPLFAALGDPTRLLLVGKLSRGEPLSISNLTHGFKVSRQAVTKHLRILEDVGLVRSARHGREILFEFCPEPVEDARRYLDEVSQQWGDALGRLKAFVESEAPK